MTDTKAPDTGEIAAWQFRVYDPGRGIWGLWCVTCEQVAMLVIETGKLGGFPAEARALHPTAEIDRLAAALAASEARVKELAGALKSLLHLFTPSRDEPDRDPLDGLADDDLIEQVLAPSDDELGDEGRLDPAITVGQIRRARAALSTAGDTTGEGRDGH